MQTFDKDQESQILSIAWGTRRCQAFPARLGIGVSNGMIGKEGKYVQWDVDEPE